MGQSFTIQTWPSRSIMLALISPTFSVSSVLISCSPLMILSLASLTQPGQSESVCLGQPNGGLVFCQDFRSGLSDHRGINEEFGRYLLKKWMLSKATPAANVAVPSRYFISRCPLILGM